MKKTTTSVTSVTINNSEIEKAKVAHANRIIEDLVRELQLSHHNLNRMGIHPRSFTFRMLDDGNTRFHVTYRRK